MEKVDKTITVAEAARIVGCSRNGILYWIHKKKYLKATVEKMVGFPYKQRYLLSLNDVKRVMKEHPIHKYVFKNTKRLVKKNMGATLGIHFPEMTALLEKQLMALSSIDEHLDRITQALNLRK